MTKELRNLNTIKKLLFGNVDRVIASVSLFLGAISIILTIFSTSLEKIRSELILTRDLIVVFGLVGLLLGIIGRYYQREKKYKDMQKHLFNQLEYSNHVIEGSIQEIYGRYKDIFLKIPEIITNTTKEEHIVFEEICRCVTQDVRDSFIDYFKSRGIDIENDIAVSVKLILGPRTIQELYGSHFTKYTERLYQKDQWVITVFRDPTTYHKNDTIRQGEAHKREVISTLYSIEGNTAFRDIVVGDAQCYYQNNLSYEYDHGNYQNENTNFPLNYNSTLVVPMVLGKSHEDYKYLGFLAVDSLNKAGDELYNKDECYQLLNHAALALTNYYLALVLYHDLDYISPNEE
jgi:hypothetical protein